MLEECNECYKLYLCPAESILVHHHAEDLEGKVDDL